MLLWESWWTSAILHTHDGLENGHIMSYRSGDDDVSALHVALWQFAVVCRLLAVTQPRIPNVNSAWPSLGGQTRPHDRVPSLLLLAYSLLTYLLIFTEVEETRSQRSTWQYVDNYCPWSRCYSATAHA